MESIITHFNIPLVSAALLAVEVVSLSLALAHVLALELRPVRVARQRAGPPNRR